LVIVYFGQWFEYYSGSTPFWATFFRGTSHVLILIKIVQTSFWATFTQTHLVTLVLTQGRRIGSWMHILLELGYPGTTLVPNLGLLFSEQSKFIRAGKVVEGPASNGTTVKMVKELEYHMSINFAQRVRYAAFTQSDRY
jgi:hypothetical protein